MASVTNYDWLVKALLIGDSGVGKSSILKRFVDNEAPTAHQSTIGVDFKIKTMEKDGKVVKLQIWDTAGQERFRTITRSYYRGAQAIVIVYDITNAESFNNVRGWMEDIDQYAAPNVTRVLVGNKCDLAGKREVESGKGQEFARTAGMKFLEASAKDNTRVTDIFTTLVDEFAGSPLAGPPGGGPKRGDKPKGVQLKGDEPAQPASGGCC